MTSRFLASLPAPLLLSVALLGCGGDDGGGSCDVDLIWEVGDEGHADPLGAGANEARAGRVEAADLVSTERGLEMWEAGDFVLANDKVAIVIEDVGDSELYDPWGGRPVGFAQVQGGELVQPSEFGEMFILAGQNTIVTDTVSVINDGSDGGPAIVRASGRMAPLPLTVPLLEGLFNMDLSETSAAIDYVLEPGAEQVNIVLRYRSAKDKAVVVEPVIHAFMYMKRLNTYVEGHGFGGEGKPGEHLILVGPTSTSIGYEAPGQRLMGGVGIAGFVSNFTDSYEIDACAETEVAHARLTIAGPGVNAVQKAMAAADGRAMRTITGVVRDSNGAGVPDVRVHATNTDGDYITRVYAGSDGAYEMVVPSDASVQLYAWERGYAMAGPVAADASTVDLSFAATGFLHITASEVAGPSNLPVKVQILPVAQALDVPPSSYGEGIVAGGRLHVDWAVTGDTTLRVPAGSWEVVVSRGYEYEIYTETVPVAADETVDVIAALERSVDSAGFMCADYHIHTFRSPDSGDDGLLKVSSAVADGLEIPLRSDHDYVDSFETEIAALGVEDWAFPVGALELTTMEGWGHFGVFPLIPDPSKRNGGMPNWIDFPNMADMNRDVELRAPIDVFEEVRARPERPVIIVNHPRSGGVNYFHYVGLDPITGLADDDANWDKEFRLVEIFNDSGWKGNREGTVADWLAVLGTGRRMFAVGSSDSHSVATAPTGYPRTCLAVGVDTPAGLTDDLVRDVSFGGHSVISGGIFITATVGGEGPGEDATGTSVDIVVQAPTWVDVDELEVVVDGQTVALMALTVDDVDVGNPAIRYSGSIDFTPASGGSYVIVAATGSSSLAPVQPGRAAFGVSNPIFVAAP